MSPIPTTGASYGYFLDRNSMLQLDAAQGDANRWFSNETISATLIGLSYKRFNGNSFYYRTGVDYRRLNLSSNDKEDSLFTSTERLSAKSEVIAIGFAIGNQWQFKNFTLGCDWIGIDVPVSKLKSEYRSTDPKSSTYADNKSDWERIEDRPTAQLLRFYLGSSF